MECMTKPYGRWCLNDNFNEGLCCKSDLSDTDQTQACKDLANNQFCAEGTAIKNKFMREALIPANVTMCPISADTKIDLTVSDVFTYKEHQWDFKVPLVEAKDWNCKYSVQATSLGAVADPA